MPIPETLFHAYAATAFWVTGVKTPFVIRIGQRSAELEAMHAEWGVRCSAFLTAWNPRSEPQPEAINRAAHVRMVAELAEAGYRCIDGIGEDPSGQWPGEESVLAIGVAKATAEQVGRRYGQNAIVWVGEGVVPELVVLTDLSGPAGDE